MGNLSSCFPHFLSETFPNHVRFMGVLETIERS